MRSSILTGALGALAVALLVPAVSAQEAPTRTMLVTYASEAGLDQSRSHGELSAADPGSTEIAGRVAVAELTAAEVADLRAAPAVLAVEPDQIAYAAEAPNDPCYTTPASCGGLGAWHIDRAGFPAAWDVSHGGVVVAVVDSGIASPPIPELQGKVLNEIDATGGTPTCASGSAVHHGTQVSALLGARTSNGIGTAGVGWDVQVLPVRVWAGPVCGGTLISYVVNGITQARNAGAGIINLSITTPTRSTSLEAVINDAVAAGIVVVAAAGNSGSESPNVGDGGYPAFQPNVIAVGGTTTTDARAGFSNFGTWVDVYAPAVSLPTFTRSGALVAVDGTSFSAPIVAGVVALMRAARPGLTPAQISDIIVRNADAGGGVPRIDARGALYDAVFGANPPAGVGVVASSASTIEVMARSNDGSPWARTLGSATSRWTPLDGILGGDADLASMAPGRLDVVARGFDGAIFYKARVNGAWSQWFPLGGVASSDLAVVSWGPNRLDIFARGLDGALWHNAFTGASFTGWTSLGGQLGSEPDVTTWGPGRLDVFARGTDGGIFHLAFASGQWQPWEPLGGLTTVGPGAVAWSANRVDVVARGLDNQLWQKAWTGTEWGPWFPLGGFLVSPPEISSRGPGRLEIFARGGDQQVYEMDFTGSGFTGWFPST